MIEIDMRVVGQLVLVMVLAFGGICEAQTADDRPAAGTRMEYMKSVYEAVFAEWKPSNVFSAHLHNPYLGPWVTRLRVTVAATGELRDVVVDSSSGLAPFDDEAVRTFRAIQRFAPPPAELLDPITSTVTFPFSLYSPGWPPPQYLGDALLRAPQTTGWEAGGSFDVQRRTRVLSGSASASGTATYQRISITATASHFIPRVGVLELEIPFDMLHYEEPSSSSIEDLAGFGDSLIHLHRYWRRRAWSLSYFIGTEIPTGKTEAIPLVGQTVPAIVQLGTGTFNPDVGVCLGRWIDGTTSVQLCDHARYVLYANSNGYREPWMADARLLVSKTLFCRQASARAGLFYEHRGTVHWTGQARPVDGHQELFAEASVWFVIFRGLAVQSTIELPVYESVDGTQVADTFRVLGSISYDFARL